MSKLWLIGVWGMVALAFHISGVTVWAAVAVLFGALLLAWGLSEKVYNMNYAGPACVWSPTRGAKLVNCESRRAFVVGGVELVPTVEVPLVVKLHEETHVMRHVGFWGFVGAGVPKIAIGILQTAALVSGEWATLFLCQGLTTTAHLFHMAYSRKEEYLADENAVRGGGAVDDLNKFLAELGGDPKKWWWVAPHPSHAQRAKRLQSIFNTP